MNQRKHFISISILILFTLNLLTSGIPLKGNATLSGNNTNSTDNDTVQDLYVIRQVTYEIGILVDANDTNDTSADYDNGNSTSAEIEQIVQLTFVGNNSNGTFNLGDIHDPIQTNFSGQVITGVANLTNSSIPIYGTITNFTQTNGGPVQLETYNLTNELPQGTFFDKGGLSNLTVLPSLIPSVIT